MPDRMDARCVTDGEKQGCFYKDVEQGSLILQRSKGQGLTVLSLKARYQSDHNDHQKE